MNHVCFLIKSFVLYFVLQEKSRLSAIYMLLTVRKLAAKRCAFDSGIWTEKDLPARQRFGPYEGIVTNDKREATNSGYSWEVSGIKMLANDSLKLIIS